MNKSLADEAFSAALTIGRCTSLVAVQKIVRTFAKPYGFDRFVLFSATPSRGEVVEKLYWVEGDWFSTGEQVDALTYVRHCPVTHHILEATEPFFWSKTCSKEGEMYRVVTVPRGPGLHGIQIPFFGPPGLEGALSMGGNQIEASPPVRLAMSVIGAQAFYTSRRLIETPPDTTTRKLTERERQVLAWTAAGQRQSDIAAILGLSERTIENHLRHIRIRLGVATTAQAVKLALRSGEISG